jgi:hypothetical protein
MLAGEALKDLAEELGIAERTLYRWRHQVEPSAVVLLERSCRILRFGDPLRRRGRALHVGD